MAPRVTRMVVALPVTSLRGSPFMGQSDSEERSTCFALEGKMTSPSVERARRALASFMHEAVDYGYRLVDADDWETSRDRLARTVYLCRRRDGDEEIFTAKLTIDFAPGGARPLFAAARTQDNVREIFAIHEPVILEMLPEAVADVVMPCLDGEPDPPLPFPLPDVPRHVFLRVMGEMRSLDERLAEDLWPEGVHRVSGISDAVDLICRLRGGPAPIDARARVISVLGLPSPLVDLERMIFNTLPPASRRGWPERFAAAIPGRGNIRGAAPVILERAFSEIVVPSLPPLAQEARDILKSAVAAIAGKKPAGVASNALAEAAAWVGGGGNAPTVFRMMLAVGKSLSAIERGAPYTPGLLLTDIFGIIGKAAATDPSIPTASVCVERLSDIVIDVLLNCAAPSLHVVSGMGVG